MGYPSVDGIGLMVAAISESRLLTLGGRVLSAQTSGAFASALNVSWLPSL